MKYIRRKLRRDPWWHVAGLSLGILFALMLMAARLYPDVLNRFDQSVESFLVPHQTLPVIEFFLTVTVLGSALGITICALGAAFLLRRNRFAVLQLFLLLLWASVSMGIAKAFVERARPEALLWLDPLNSYSFPSGHTTLTTAFYGFLAVYVYRRVSSPAAKVLSVLAAGAIILAVGASRLVLNAHYFTDVVAGLLLGLFWLCVVFMLPRPR